MRTLIAILSLSLGGMALAPSESAASVGAPVPQVTGTVDQSAMPEIRFHFTWPAVPGATEYKVYKAAAPYINCPTTASDPAWGTTPDAVVTTNSYRDDPNVGWWKLPVTGAWRGRGWCYAVSAVVNGIESAKGIAVNPDNQLNPPGAANKWAIGASGYLDLYYYSACTNGKRVIPFPYMKGQDIAHFYYTNAAGGRFEIPAISLYNAYPHQAGDPNYSYNEEWEFKWPVLDASGSVIPIDPNGHYTYTLVTGDGAHYAGSFIPPLAAGQAADNVWYTQTNIVRVIRGPNCPTSSRVNYNWYQPVTR